MTAEEKLELQFRLACQLFVSYFDFPAGKAFVTLVTVWATLLHSTNPENKMLACLPVIMAMDYLTGTFRAIAVKRNWTASGSFVGLVRGLVVFCFLGLTYLVAFVTGRWIFIGAVSAVFVTELCSSLENIRGCFPKSKLSLYISILLHFFNRKYVNMISELNEALAKKGKKIQEVVKKPRIKRENVKNDSN